MGWMASVEYKPVMGLEAEPSAWSWEVWATPPEAESLLAFQHPKEGKIWLLGGISWYLSMQSSGTMAWLLLSLVFPVFFVLSCNCLCFFQKCPVLPVFFNIMVEMNQMVAEISQFFKMVASNYRELSNSVNITGR